MAKKKLSRYEQVLRTLDDVQGDNLPDYQGYRAFWRLPIEEFECFELYGQRMIAAPEAGDTPDPNASGGSCCESGGKEKPGDGAHDGKAHEGKEESGCCGHDSGAPASGAGLPPGLAVQAVDLDPEWQVDANCWPSGGSRGGGGGSGGSRGPKRSDRSGLIRGLKGQYPFDGSIYPPLLWNADRAASAAEIQLIADWIDDGCPTGEEKGESSKARIAVEANQLAALACGDRAHRVSTRTSNATARSMKGLRVRKEISSLSHEELRRLRQALACMYRYNPHWLDERSFDHWARIHTNSCQHGWEQFLPWHRLYLYFFEQTLQDYDKTITLPYWAWTDYSDVNRGTYQTEQLDIGVLPDAYQCWLNEAAIARLKDTRLFDDKELARLESAAGTAYNSGRRFLIAVDIPYSLVKDPQTGQAAWSDKTRALYNELRRVNPLWFPNRWPGSTGTATHYPVPKDIDAILDVSDWAGFGGGPEEDHHFGALEEVHNGMHNFAGGSNPDYPPPADLGIAVPDPQNQENPPAGWMTDNRVTAYDPIFWAHHSNVDRLWARWQELHPGVEPDDLDGSLPPWSLAVRDSLSVKKLGYEYMRDSYMYSASNDVAMMRFNSEMAGVRQSVLTTHRKAEIRLHRVQRANLMNAIVRVFLNTPDAGPETAMDGNNRYVGHVMTFHGSCYGGAGHCDMPLPRSRQFDRRPLHHHEPRNFRLDATAAVQSLLGEGEEDLSVHLVVLDLEGKPMDGAIYMEGVSLNFMD